MTDKKKMDVDSLLKEFEDCLMEMYRTLHDDNLTKIIPLQQVNSGLNWVRELMVENADKKMKTKKSDLVRCPDEDCVHGRRMILGGKSMKCETCDGIGWVLK